MIAEFLEAKRESGRREEYLRIQASVLGLFSKVFPAETQVHEIGARAIEQWAQVARGKSAEPELSKNDVRNPFNFAIRRRYVASNPVDHLEKIILDKKPVEILTVEQAARLLEAAEVDEGKMTPYISIGLFADLRTREIAVLDWKDIALQRRRSRFTRPRRKREFGVSCR